jgi:ABC-2 type transport system permease protein
MESIQGFSYIDFILPGLVGLVALTNAFNGPAFSVFHARWDDYINEVLTSSLAYWEMLIGYLGGSLFFGLSTSFAITLIGVGFTDVSFVHPGILLLFLILSCILFGCFGIMTGLAANEFGHINMASNFVIMPLVFLGGVFFSLEMIPETWQAIVMANPLLYIVNGLRYGMVGTSDIAIGTATSILVCCTTVAVLVTHALIKSGFGIRE